MYKIKNFTDNDDVKTLEERGAFKVIEYQRDLSASPQHAQAAYFAQVMNAKRRQVICDLSKSPVTISKGAMQWMAGDVSATTGVKGAGDLLLSLSIKARAHLSLSLPTNTF